MFIVAAGDFWTKMSVLNFCGPIAAFRCPYHSLAGNVYCYSLLLNKNECFKLAYFLNMGCMYTVRCVSIFVFAPLFAIAWYLHATGWVQGVLSNHGWYFASTNHRCRHSCVEFYKRLWLVCGFENCKRFFLVHNSLKRKLLLSIATKARFSNTLVLEPADLFSFSISDHSAPLTVSILLSLPPLERVW